MQALVLTRYGGPDAWELRDVPKPVPGPGEILVRVQAAGLNPVDYKLRDGKLRVIQRYSLPVVAGSELSGVVEERGPGARRFAEGDRVFARVDKAVMGAFAEYAVVSEVLAAAVPAGTDLTAAAGVPLAGLTALQALRDQLRVAPAQRIFISGGGGGVGTFAIQIGKWLGASIATTASARGEELVRRMGADVVVDYTKERVEDVLSGYDAAFDLVGGDALLSAFRVVKRGATVVSVAAMPEPATAREDLQRGSGLAALFWVASARIRRQAHRYGVSYRYLFMHSSGTELAELAALLDQGKLTVVVDRCFAFPAIAEALAYLEQGRAKGKVIVQMVAP